MTAVSIIIPYHNSAGCDRREMLDALIATIPDRPDVEIIAVDDHSELTWTPARPPAQARLHLIPNRPERRYAGTARNTGLEHATGQFVLFADSDDLYVTDALDELIDRAAADEAVDVILFRMGSFRDNGEMGERHENNDRQIQRYLDNGVYPLTKIISPICKMVRRDFIIDHHLRFGGTKYGNDHTFAINLAVVMPRLAVWDRVVYRIRQGNAGLENAIGKRNILERIDLHKQTNDILIAYGFSPEPMIYRVRNYVRRFPLLVAQECVRARLEGHALLPDIFAALRRRMSDRRMTR